MRPRPRTARRHSGPSTDLTKALRARVSHLEAALERTERFIDQKERVCAANAMELRALADELREAKSRLESKTNELERSNARLREMDRSRLAFFAATSHELRTPITSILAFARLVRRQLADVRAPENPLPAPSGAGAIPLAEQIDIIVHEAERLARLVDDMMDLAKIEARRIEWRLEDLRPAEFIMPAVSAMAAVLDGWGAVVQTDVPDDLPQVRGDRGRLVQVMTNLLGNAGKFGGSGNVIRISARRAMLAPHNLFGAGEGVPRPFVLVSVRDSGRGIAQADLARVFDRFVRIGPPPPGRPEGSGLGLALAKEIIDVHGGWIWAVSDVGKGSIFTFSLPAAETDAEAGGGADEIALLTGGGDAALGRE